MSDLLVAPCDYQAAKHAVMHWHYSRSMPAGKLSTFGVWEHDRFIGAVVFGRGASDAIGKPYGLDQTQVCELVRVALTDHGHQVSEIVARSVRSMNEASPGLRLIVSYADPAHGHRGGIYQAGNWIYNGRTAPSAAFIDSRGKRWHSRMVSSTGATVAFGQKITVPKPTECTRVELPGKHRYLYPLDRAMRRQVTKLAQPYPRGLSVHGDTSAVHAGEVGSSPADRSQVSA
jgi:hypothetical protein